MLLQPPPAAPPHPQQLAAVLAANEATRAAYYQQQQQEGAGMGAVALEELLGGGEATGLFAGVTAVAVVLRPVGSCATQQGDPC
jgi:hypothetical protein